MYLNIQLNLETGGKTISLAFKKGLGGTHSGRGSRGAESSRHSVTPEQMLMWIHEAAAYHTLLTSGAERSGSCNVPRWLYWITAAWPQYKGWLVDTDTHTAKITNMANL